MTNTNKPTTVRFDKNTQKAIEFLKETNQGKFGVPTTTQVLTYAVQLAVFEQVKDGEITEKVKELITFPDLKEKINEFLLMALSNSITIKEDDQVNIGVTPKEIDPEELKKNPFLTLNLKDY